MFNFPDCNDTFPASPMALKYMEAYICDASAMAYCFCIPRDMNHPISDYFNNKMLYVMFTQTLLKISFLGYKPFGYRFTFYMETLICDASAIHRRSLTIIRKSALKYSLIIKIRDLEKLDKT